MEEQTLRHILGNPSSMSVCIAVAAIECVLLLLLLRLLAAKF